MDIKSIYYNSLKIAAIVSALFGIVFLVLAIVLNIYLMGILGMLLTGLTVFWSVIYRILSKIESRQNKKQSFVYYLLIVLSLLPLTNVDLLLSGIIIVLCVIPLQIKH